VVRRRAPEVPATLAVAVGRRQDRGQPAATVGPGPGAHLTPVDVARGWLTGVLPQVDGGLPGPRCDPTQALEQVLVEALARPPCLVLFSGGRDSSLVLSAAAAVARRHGLPTPVAVTERFADEAASESAWQEAVVRSVGVEDWVRFPADEEADLLGPAAQASLERVGLRWPALAHSRGWFLPKLVGTPRSDGVPVATVVDGEGGDELLAARRLAPVVRVLHHHRLRGRDVDQLVRGLGWRALRAARSRPAVRAVAPPWLQPDAATAFEADLLDDLLDEPLTWAGAVPRLLRTRALAEGIATVDAVLAAAGARAVHPLLDPSVVSSVAAAGGRLGFAGREDALRCLFGPHLPAGVERRRDKARFNRVVFGPRSRAFAATWTGTGVAAELVDVDRLRAEWQSDEPSALSYLALHAAWLARSS
jgi:hypothetical protein